MNFAHLLAVALLSHCYQGSINKFQVEFVERPNIWTKTISYRDMKKPNKIFIVKHFVRDECSIVSTLAYWSDFDGNYKLGTIKADQAEECCNKERNYD